MSGESENVTLINVNSQVNFINLTVEPATVGITLSRLTTKAVSWNINVLATEKFALENFSTNQTHTNSNSNHSHFLSFISKH